MSAALITALVLALASLVWALVLGYTASTGADVLQHTTWSTFATLLVLLAHCLTMFYLIGKGKAVREAAAEAGLSGGYGAAIAEVRRPVFTLASLAIALTMATAILGAGVDTRVLPAALHSFLGLAAVAANLAAVRAGIVALTTSLRVTAEVDWLLGAQAAAGARSITDPKRNS
jgi:hypothetical protein